MKGLSKDDGRLSEFQLSIVRDFLGETLNQAASSMGQMLRMRIKADLLGFGEGVMGHIQEFDELGQFRVHVMKVALKGPIGGAFYFIINSHEADTINSICMPAGSQSNSESRQMKFAFISEIENMIAALATSEISEFLGVQLFGQVPEIAMVQGNRVNEFLREEARANHATFYVSSVLAGLVIEISPHFIWMLDDQFKQTLKLNIVS